MPTDPKPKSYLRGNQDAIAGFLTEAFESNDLRVILGALNKVMKSQNVLALAEKAEMRREGLYRTFDGVVDPSLGRTLKLLMAMNVTLAAKPFAAKPQLNRPKPGRPRKTPT